MKTYFLAFATVLFSNNVQATAPEGTHRQTVVLSVGRFTTWKVPPGTAISVSDGRVVRVTDQGSQLKVVGKKLGVAELRAGESVLRLHVVSDATERIHLALSAALSFKRGLSLSIDTSSSGSSVVVKGRLLRFDDWLELAEKARNEGTGYSFEASLSAEDRARARSHFRALIRGAQLPELALDFKSRALVTVPLDPADLKARASKLLQPYGFYVEASGATLSLEPLVRVRMIVAEFRKSMHRTIGIKWPETLGGQILPSFKMPSDTSSAITLQALEDRGISKVLASPTLLCRSGKEAQFLAGGEFPIKIAHHKSHDVVWKRYGVLLKIRPKADFSGRMSIGIETEVSSIDSGRTVDGVPGLYTNRIESHFDLSAPRTIVLSGLIKNESGNSSSGLPGLSSIPILGPLFSSRDFQDQRSELVVFVTPELDRADEEASL